MNSVIYKGPIGTDGMTVEGMPTVTKHNDNVPLSSGERMIYAYLEDTYMQRSHLGMLTRLRQCTYPATKNLVFLMSASRRHCATVSHDSGNRNFGGRAQ